MVASTAPNPSIKLIIFDCDGILVDSESISIDINRAMLHANGWYLSRDEVIERFLGTSMANVQAQLEAHTGRPVPEGWAEDLRARNEIAFEEHLRAVPYVREAICELEPYGRCVASSSSPRRIQHSLELTDLWTKFDATHVFSASMVQNGKPAPDLFLFAAETVGVPPEECVVIEDSRFGARAARAAGMRVLGFGGGLTPPSWLVAEGAEVFDDMRDLPNVIHALA